MEHLIYFPVVMHSEIVFHRSRQSLVSIGDPFSTMHIEGDDGTSTPDVAPPSRPRCSYIAPLPSPILLESYY
jgi:hypothetical protein